MKALLHEIRATVATRLVDLALSVEFRTTMNLAEGLMELRYGRSVEQVVRRLCEREERMRR